MLRKSNLTYLVRISPDAHERLKRLAHKAAREGWESLGVKREDLPTLAAVMAEALVRLEETSK